MAKVDIIQTSFAGGEIGPSLYGRTDVAQYQNACQIAENFIPRPYGSLVSAPGSKYVATVSDSTLKTRLIKFVFNRLDAYAIEMGDLYMRFFTDRGQVVTKAGTETLTAFSANLKAHWKCNDNTNSTTVLDAQTTHDGTTSTITQSLTTTAIVSTGLDLDGRYHISVADHDNFTRTASSQPMTVVGWFYYSSNGSDQCLFSKTGEYELSINSQDKLSFSVSNDSTPTKLLLHMDGTDASTTFTDSSDAGHTVTANGNAQIDTAQSKFGGASGLFDGTGDYLSIADHASWQLGGGTGDFTIDFWVRFSSLAEATQYFIAQIQDDTNHWSVFLDSPNLVFRLVESGASSISISGSWSPSVDTWYHIAVVRSGTTFYLFVNGTQITSSSDADDIPDFTGSLYIGSFETVSQHIEFFGWMEEIRIVNSAVWTSNFSVPTASYQLSSVSNSWQTSNSIPEGWNFIALVFKGDGTATGDCKIYVDALLKTTAFSSDAAFVRMGNTASLFRIGSTSAAGAKNWNGKVDNLAFIHQELTSANIATLYSTSAYQITTVFTEDEVFGVQFTQLNDVIWLTHPNHPQQKLVRTSDNEWTIADFPFIGGPFLDSNTDTSTTLSVSATLGTINVTAATGKNVFTRSTSTLGHHNAYWAIGGLSLTNATTGLQEEGYVKITHVINSYTATATVIKSLKAATATSNWAEGAWSAVRGYPASVILHERRLWFARTNYEPQKLWGSRVFLFEYFAIDTQADDDAINIPLASNESNEISWLASAKSLLAGTYGGAFVINSGSSEPITPSNVNAAEEVGYGSESSRPARIGNLLFYIQRFAKRIRELFYFWDLDTYKAEDRTILAPHILGDGVVEMDYQQNPDTIFYCVRTEGTLALMTREPGQEVVAWSRRTTSGTYTSVTVIPSQSSDYDEVWTVVERWINGSPRKYVEYFENIIVPDRQDQCIYLDSALTYDAFNVSSLSSATISLSASTGSVTVTSSTGYFVGGHVQNKLRAIDGDGNTIGEGTITATASTTSITLSITTTFNALSYATGRWGVSVRSVSGLDHLNGKTVGILTDGLVDSVTKTVASETVTLTSTAFVVHVGLPYDQLFFSLPKEAGTVRGTAQGKFQRINEIFLKLNRSTQNFKYGTDASNLDDINLAFTPTVTSLYTGILPPQGGGITMRGGYKRGAQVYIKNSNPLPMEILSIMMTLDTNEK